MHVNIRVIVGLGNPGRKYFYTRHNIGFRIVESLGVAWNSSELMESSEIMLDDNKVMLIKPLTYMNNSGKIIPGLFKNGIKPEEILVVHDDLEKRFGNISIKQGGSARGHNGLRSIIEFADKDFFRMRFGIGRPENKDEVGNYVLSNFTKSEEEEIPVLIEDASIALKAFLQN